MPEYKKAKDYFDTALAQLLAEKITQHYPEFHSQGFIREASHNLTDFELKARVAQITIALHKFLPKDFRSAMSILLKILGPPNPHETGMFTTGYWLMPVAFYIEQYGLEDIDTSLQAIYEITKRHTGEFAIRPFIQQYSEKTLAIMQQWSQDENVHVRRLASEGLRPRLPWAKKLAQFIHDPTPIFPILEQLKEDPSRFVQKSVANCLNDILKDNYPTAMTILTRWSTLTNPHTRWIVRHALRNEIKKQNPAALKLINQQT